MRQQFRTIGGPPSETRQMTDLVDDSILYHRVLPGGGSVAIEALPSNGHACRARVRVERRCDPRRRAGHAPPVIAEASGDTLAVVLERLYDIASDNVAIARELVRWQAGPTRRGDAA